jgi:hypothetical protein
LPLLLIQSNYIHYLSHPLITHLSSLYVPTASFIYKLIFLH